MKISDITDFEMPALFATDGRCFAIKKGTLAMTENL